MKRIYLLLIILLLCSSGLEPAFARTPDLLLEGSPHGRTRDAMAIANARWLGLQIVAAYRKALECDAPVESAATLSLIMTHGITPVSKPTCPQMLHKKNPWAGTTGAPGLAVNQSFHDHQASKASISQILAEESNLGQVQGFFRPRNLVSGTPAEVGVAVYLKYPILNPGIGPIHVFTMFKTIDESGNDRVAQILASRLHNRLKTRYRRALASSLPLSSSTEFQISVLGRDPSHTEVPDFWAFQGPPQWGKPSCAPVILNEESVDGPITMAAANSFNFRQVQIGYFPGTSTSSPILFTAIYLLHPLKDSQGREHHVFIQKTLLP